MATCCRGKTKRLGASSQSIDNLATLPTAADSRQLTSVQLESDASWWKGQSGVAAGIRRWNDNAVSGRLVWNQLWGQLALGFHPFFYQSLSLLACKLRLFQKLQTTSLKTIIFFTISEFQTCIVIKKKKKGIPKIVNMRNFHFCTRNDYFIFCGIFSLPLQLEKKTEKVIIFLWKSPV